MESHWEQARNLSVIVGIVIAVLSLRTTTSLTRRKQSSDLVFAGRNDDKFIAGIRAFRARAAGNLRNLPTLESSSDDAANARYVLNYFEALAVGVRKKISWFTRARIGWSGSITLNRLSRQREAVAP